jgi:hypothetical protein
LDLHYTIFLCVTLFLGARGTDLNANKKAAHGRDVNKINSFHSPPVAHAIMASIQAPKVKLINWYVAIFVLLEADDISIAVTHVTESDVLPIDILICLTNYSVPFVYLS